MYIMIKNIPINHSKKFMITNSTIISILLGTNLYCIPLYEKLGAHRILPTKC